MMWSFDVAEYVGVERVQPRKNQSDDGYFINKVSWQSNDVSHPMRPTASFTHTELPWKRLCFHAATGLDPKRETSETTLTLRSIKASVLSIP